MKTISLFLVLILLSITGLGWSAGPFKGDTIRIKLADYMIEVISPDLTRNPLKEAGISEKAIKISDWLGAVNINEPKPDELIYILISNVDDKEKLNYQNVAFENRKRTSEKMVFSEGKILQKGFGNYVIEMRDPVFTVIYYLQQLKSCSRLAERK